MRSTLLPSCLAFLLLVLTGCHGQAAPAGAGAVADDAGARDASTSQLQGGSLDGGRSVLDAATPPPEAEGNLDAGVVERATAPGWVNMQVTGLPAGADAWVAVTRLGAESWWVRRTGALEVGLAEVSVAAAPVEIDGVAYTPEPISVRVDVSSAAGDVTVAYAPAPTSFYDADPAFNTCTPGTLTEATRERVVATVGFVRALVGLPPVAYGTADEAMMGEAAVVYAINDTPDPHAPPNDATCFSPLAFEGAQKGNLRLVGSTTLAGVRGETPEAMVRAWALDRDVRPLGHRRWLLDPFLPEVSFGMAHGSAQPGPYARSFPYYAGAALRVMYGSRQADLREWDVPEYVAYPRGDFPAALIQDYPYLSFQVVADSTTRWGDNFDGVSFAGTSVRVTNQSGDEIVIDDVDANSDGAGLPNQLSWRADGLRLGETYTVAITGVKVAGLHRDYRYEFVLR